jgi:gamma-glutamyltranspeptidase
MLGFPAADPVRAWPRKAASPVMARGGMVASAHPLVTAAGLDVLRRGGNAVDAAVGAALVAAVVMPEMCGLGGDLFAIVHGPGREPIAILGSGASPRAATLDQMRKGGVQTPAGAKMSLRGPLSISVPGMVDAYETLLTRLGSRPFAELAQPAIAYARDGYPLTALGAAAIAATATELARDPAAAAIFLPGGDAPAVGSILRQPDLARSLERIAEGGARAFYRGDLAREIVSALAAAGAALSAQDFADHATTLAPPISTTYRGRTILQTGLPSQGLILLEALNILEHTPAATLARHDGPAVHAMAEALKLAYADRLGYARDPATGPSPVERLISKPWAAQRFAAFDPARAASEVPPGGLDDGDTTYLCVVDGQGLMVSLIQSVSSAFGSGIVAGDTGILLNNRVGRGYSLQDGHPNLFVPGRRTMHTLNCYLVADETGMPILVGGTPGGDGQPQWNLQALSALIDGGLDVQAAVEAPRWTVWPGTDPHDLPSPYELRVETRLGEPAIAELEALGHTIRRTGAWGGTGAAQAIARDPATGVLVGGSDPRVEGLALGF